MKKLFLIIMLCSLGLCACTKNTKETSMQPETEKISNANVTTQSETESVTHKNDKSTTNQTVTQPRENAFIIEVLGVTASIHSIETYIRDGKLITLEEEAKGEGSHLICAGDETVILDENGNELNYDQFRKRVEEFGWNSLSSEEIKGKIDLTKTEKYGLCCKVTLDKKYDKLTCVQIL